MSVADHDGAARSHVLLQLDESAVRAEIAELIATDEALTGPTAGAVTDADIHAACCAVVEGTDLSEERGAAVFHAARAAIRDAAPRSPPSASVSAPPVRWGPTDRAGPLWFWRPAPRLPQSASASFCPPLPAPACGDLALLECADGVTGEPRHVLCAIARDTAE